MAAAYRYADSGQRSTEINLLNAIDRFGVVAVMGRPVLYAKEIRAMILAEKIIQTHHEFMRSENWAQWTHDNPNEADLYMRAKKLVDGE